MRRRRPEPGARRAAFTLIELMMVLAILGIIVGIGLPAVISTVKKGPMRQAVSDLEEGFLKARMLAILTGQPAELVINAADGTLEVRSVTETAPDPALASAEPLGEPLPEELDPDAPPRTEVLPTFSASLDPSVAFRHLTVSLRDMMDESQAAVRFQPNGTCDALAATLFSEAGEERTIALEITTGRARVETIR